MQSFWLAHPLSVRSRIIVPLPPLLFLWPTCMMIIDNAMVPVPALEDHCCSLLCLAVGGYSQSQVARSCACICVVYCRVAWVVVRNVGPYPMPKGTKLIHRDRSPPNQKSPIQCRTDGILASLPEDNSRTASLQLAIACPEKRHS